MPSPSDEAIRRYRRRLTVHRDRTALALIAAWDALQAHNEADVDLYTRRTATAFTAAKSATVALSAGFVAVALGIRPVGVNPDAVDVTPYTRGPFLAHWHALTQGRPFDEALLVGRSTAEAVGFDFVQSVANRTGDHVVKASGRTVKWRRVPDVKACDWCRLVAGDHYNSAETADFGHARDGCTVVPV